MKQLSVTGLMLLLFLSYTAIAQENLVLKKRLAIIDFIDGTEGTSRTAYTRTSTDSRNLEQGSHVNSHYSTVLITMLTTALVKSNAFTVVERQQLESIFREQKLSLSGAVTSQSAAKLNELLGVQLLVTGSITEYGVKIENKESSAGRLFSNAKAKSRARVSLDLRILNANSGEILVAETASGTAEAKSGGLKVMNIGSSSAVDDNTLLDSAVRKAVDNCVSLIKDAATKVKWEGSIIKVNTDGSLYIKPGSNGGVNTDMAFNVYRRGESITDPETGLSLGSELKKIGKITVISDIGEGNAAKAQITEGKGIRQGDVIRLD